jgi:hypothetical protein
MKLKLFLAAVLALAATSCGSSCPCGEENDGVPDIIDDETDLDTFIVGRLGVGELNQITGTDPGHSTLIQAFFNDFSNYQVILADRVEFPPACMVYTSRPESSGEPIPLQVTRVVIEGLQGGTLNMEPAGNPPKIATQVISGRAFTEAEVVFKVESSGDSGFFPPLQAELPPPQVPVLTKLGEFKNPDLKKGLQLGITADRATPLEVKWEPGQGKYLEVKLVPGRGSETPWAKLRCITFDDGCLHIPPEAIAFLVQDKASDFQFKIERHNFVLHSVREGDKVKAAALIDVNSALEATVLR